MTPAKHVSVNLITCVCSPALPKLPLCPSQCIVIAAQPAVNITATLPHTLRTARFAEPCMPMCALTVDEHFDAVMADLLKEIGGRLWRSRQASAAALADLLQGRRWTQLAPHFTQVGSVTVWAVEVLLHAGCLAVQCFSALHHARQEFAVIAFDSCWGCRSGKPVNEFDTKSQHHLQQAVDKGCCSLPRCGP